jgi:hypothetical protein
VGHTYLKVYREEKHLTIRERVKVTHDPATFPSWENALIVARATARLEGGRGIELLTHARKVMKAA